MNRTTTARLIGIGVAAAAITLVGAPAAFATDITNPADNPYPVTVVVGGQTYVDGNDTLPGFDDYACTQIPGVNYDFANNQIDYPDGQVAPWTEWSRIPGYAVWKSQQTKASASPKPTSTASSAPSSSPSPSSSSGSGTSGSTSTSGSKSSSGSSATSTRSTSGTHSSTSAHRSSVSTASGSAAGADSSHSSASTSSTIGASSSTETSTDQKPTGTAKAHHAGASTSPSDTPSPSDSQSPATVVLAGSDPTDPPSAEGAIAPISSVGQRPGSGTGDTSLAGFGILAALAIAGLGVLGADQLRRLGGRRLAKGAR